MKREEIIKLLQDKHERTYKKEIADNSIRYTDAENMLTEIIIQMNEAVDRGHVSDYSTGKCVAITATEFQSKILSEFLIILEKPNE